MIGILNIKNGGALWEPILDSPFPVHCLELSSAKRLPEELFEFVLQNPFDIVHISKPHFSGILVGLLYRLIWNSHVIMDVDDEELGMVKEPTTLALSEMHPVPKNRLKGSLWPGGDWTRVGVGLWDIFDQVTVSNPALQERYGGQVIPHARSEERLRPSPSRKTASRKEFGIPQDAVVFLFFGSAKPHKGVLETAHAIAALGRSDVIFVVAGKIQPAELREELEAVEGLNLRILPSQPYERIADIVGLADACVLLQKEDSLVASFQLPAKLVDALAMKLVVFITPTPAVRHICEAGAVIAVQNNDVLQKISDYVENVSHYEAVRETARSYFAEHLSLEANSGILASMATEGLATNRDLKSLGPKRLVSVFRAIGGWSAFAQSRSGLSQRR